MALGVLHGRTARFASGVAVFLAARPSGGVPSFNASATPWTERLCETLSDTFLSGQLHCPNADDICRGRLGLLGVGLPEFSKSESSRRQNNLWPDNGRCRFELDHHRRNHCRQTSTAVPVLLFLGFRNWNADGVSVFCGESLYSIPRGVGCDVPGDFYALLEHRTIQYRAGECFAACSPRDCVRREYSHYSRSWRRAGFLDAWLHWRSLQYPCRLLVCVRSHLGFRRGMDCWSEILAGRHRSGGSSNGSGLTRLLCRVTQMNIVIAGLF